jgi:hypothetical protein
MIAPEPSYFTARLAGIRGPLALQLELGPDPEDALARALLALARELLDAAGDRLTLTTTIGAPRPSLRARNVRYLALPAGPELPPFVELLLLLDRSSTASTAFCGQLLLLTAPTCPRCPAVVSVCNRLAAASPGIELSVVDAQRFPELAAGCRSVPTLIIDERRALVGPISLEQLHAVLEQRGGPGELNADLSSLVRAGRLSDAGRLLLEVDGQVAFAELFSEAPLPDRVGLLLLAEQILADRPSGLDGALPQLLRMQSSSDPTRRGDLADLLGRIGSPAARQALHAMLNDPHPEVREAVQDALASQSAPN